MAWMPLVPFVDHGYSDVAQQLGHGVLFDESVTAVDLHALGANLKGPGL